MLIYKAGYRKVSCPFLILYPYLLLQYSMTRKTFSIVPHFRANSFSVDEIDELAQILRKYHIQYIKFTSTKRLALANPNKEYLDKISRELQHLSEQKKSNWITSIGACLGKNWCKHGIRDASLLATRIESIKPGFTPKGRIKVGIAGCKRCCTEPFIRDIGVVPDKKGWTLVFGGNGGGKPRIGDIVANSLSDDQVIELIRKCLTVYQENAEPKMRTARFIESFGLDNFLHGLRSTLPTGTGNSPSK